MLFHLLADNRLIPILRPRQTSKTCQASYDRLFCTRNRIAMHTSNQYIQYWQIQVCKFLTYRVWYHDGKYNESVSVNIYMCTLSAFILRRWIFMQQSLLINSKNHIPNTHFHISPTNYHYNHIHHCNRHHHPMVHIEVLKAPQSETPMVLYS